MPPYVDNSITLQDVRIIWRNFSGGPERFNPAGGKRNFTIVLDDETAERLIRDGWNVKQMNPRDGDEEPPPYFLKVSISFPRPDSKAKPPTMILITSGGRKAYDEESIEIFDIVEIETADVKIRPWDWNINGNSGRAAYMNAIYIKAYEDELARKWSDIPEIGSETLALPAGEDPNVIDVDWYEEDGSRKELTA